MLRRPAGVRVGGSVELHPGNELPSVDRKLGWNVSGRLLVWGPESRVMRELGEQLVVRPKNLDVSGIVIARRRCTDQEHRSLGSTVASKITMLYRLDLHVIVLRASGGRALPVLHVDGERVRRVASASR